MVNVKPSEHLTKLNSKDDYVSFRQQAIEKWDAMWNGDATIVSVGVGSSSIAKGALEVLDSAHAAGGNTIVREVSGNGAFWMEPWIEVKRPGSQPVVYGPLTGADVAGVIAGDREDLAVGVRGDSAEGNIQPLTSIDFFKHQVPLLTRNAGIIEPDSIEDAIARGAYDGYFKVLFEMSQEEAIAEVTAAQVRGRGGGGFPAGIKWESDARHPTSPSSSCATATKASRMCIRTATCMSAIRTGFSRESSLRVSRVMPSVATTTSVVNTHSACTASARQLPMLSVLA